jgi:hypothetical protein
MKAITLHRPWPYAIFHCGKDIENRTWQPNGLNPGDLLAIHAGKTWSDDGWDYIRDIGHNCPAEGSHPIGIVGTVIFDGLKFPGLPRDDPMPAIGDWGFGPVCWMLREPVSVDVIKIRGQQGLWDVPEEIAVALFNSRRP